MSHLIKYVLGATLIFSSSVCYADRVWNPNVVGSNPAPATNDNKGLQR